MNFNSDSCCCCCCCPRILNRPLPISPLVCGTRQTTSNIHIVRQTERQSDRLLCYICYTQTACDYAGCWATRCVSRCDWRGRNAPCTNSFRKRSFGFNEKLLNSFHVLHMFSPSLNGVNKKPICNPPLSVWPVFLASVYEPYYRQYHIGAYNRHRHRHCALLPYRIAHKKAYTTYNSSNIVSRFAFRFVFHHTTTTTTTIPNNIAKFTTVQPPQRFVHNGRTVWRGGPGFGRFRCGAFGRCDAIVFIAGDCLVACTASLCGSVAQFVTFSRCGAVDGWFGSFVVVVVGFVLSLSLSPFVRFSSLDASGL